MTMTTNLLTTANADDTFYASPVMGFDTAPGQIVRRRPVDTPQLPNAARAWQILYASRTGFGAPVAASGIVLTPDIDDPADPRPVVIYAPVFHGLGGRCAPSQLLAGAGFEAEAHHIAALLERGWTVAVPDGHGLGVTGIGPHRFLAGGDAARAVLDMARVVRALPELDAPDPAVAVWGYGDGGRAAVWAAEQQPRYAPEVDLRGVVAGAVAADPGALIAAADGGVWAGLAVAAVIGLARAYRHLPVAHILTEDGYQMAETAALMDTAALLTTYRNQPLGHWCERSDPWDDPMWRYLLANETTGRDIPQARVHLYHGADDAIVPIDMGRTLYHTYRDRGVQVSWREFLTGHAGTASKGSEDALLRLTALLPHRRIPPPPKTT
ncbi:hypothetical protein IU451_29490 [Nocardia cyriacigeorgica]|uniref:lipase family protein n=1 Tax=Nocardia cyriacigeorgica TaxID=135487 RepID=UPI001895F5FD|nr:lipase family protein [Nocardia cyriacigeorgica]MBF6326636.1 hypothetical protein [Nocardia cyriacigeorgica]